MLFAVLWVHSARALPLPLLPLTRRVLASICCICLTTLIAFVCAVTNSVCFVCAQLISPMASSRLTTTPRFLRRRYQVIFCHSLHGPSPVCVLSFSYFFRAPTRKRKNSPIRILPLILYCSLIICFACSTLITSKNKSFVEFKIQFFLI